MVSVEVAGVEVPVDVVVKGEQRGQALHQALESWSIISGVLHHLPKHPSLNLKMSP
jgi:hypothetical protein